MRWFFAIIAWPAAAHLVSTSTGELVISERTASYVLKLAADELHHVKNAETALPKAVSLDGAVLTHWRCDRDSESMTCSMTWQFPAPPSSVVVRVRLHEITLPNHVHALRATRDDLVESAVFDKNQTVATLRFEPFSNTTHDHWALSAIAALALGLAAASWRDFLSFSAGGLAGYLVHWPLSSSLLDSAVLITAAYASFEALYIRKGVWCWIALAAVGAAIMLRTHSPGVHTAVMVAALPVALLKVVWTQRLKMAREPVITRGSCKESHDPLA
jgi:hypothetical protein